MKVASYPRPNAGTTASENRASLGPPVNAHIVHVVNVKVRRTGMFDAGAARFAACFEIPG